MPKKNFKNNNMNVKLNSRFWLIAMFSFLFSFYTFSQCFSGCLGGNVSGAVSNYPPSVNTGGSGFNFDLTIYFPACTYTTYTGNFVVTFFTMTYTQSIYNGIGTLAPGSSITFSNINFPNSQLPFGTPFGGATMAYGIDISLTSPPACPTDMNGIFAAPPLIIINVYGPASVNKLSASDNNLWVAENTLFFSKQIEDAELMIYDLTGKLLFNHRLEKTSSIKINSLPEHQIYLVKFVENDKVFYKKILIN